MAAKNDKNLASAVECWPRMRASVQRMGIRGTSIVGLTVLGIWLQPSARAGLRDKDCLDCHSDKTLTKTNAAGKVVSLFVDEAKLAASSHKTNTCVGCHSDITEKHPDDEIPAKLVSCVRCHEQQTGTYGASVHGLAVKAGRKDAPGCQDCHDSHSVLPGNSPASPLHFSRQAETCGACHDKEAQDLAASVHGKALAAGVRDAPTCTDCHSEHQIQALSTNATRKISEDVCSRCHGSERINTKYHLPTDRVQTFFESYHGLAAQYGLTVAANCGSCHGYHKVLPSSNSASTIHRDNLVATCGKCHPGANEKFALSKVHVNIEAKESGPDLGSQINWWVRRIYLVLIFGVVGAMFVHNLVLFLRKVADHLRSTGRPVLRMSLTQRWQHAVLALSFIVLAITGFALKYPDSWVAWLLGSSEQFRRYTHRVAGVVLLLVGVYHILYILAQKDGRRLVKDLFPIKQDIVDVLGAVRYLAGLSREKPKIGRFGYAEKMEYWAVVWGTIIMGVTGLMLWFKMDVTQFLPRWVVDVALTIHYYEAILACLAIVVWHFYHVMFDPDVYPLNLACWDGRVTEHWRHEEHPLEQAQHVGAPPASPSPRPVVEKPATAPEATA